MVSSAEEIAFSFIEEIPTLREPDAVFDTLLTYTEQFGFSSFLAVSVPEPGESLADNIISNRWPDEWYQRYTEKDYFSMDAVGQHLQKTVEPFLWSDVPILADDAVSKKISHEAREFQLNDGCCIPIYSKDGFLSAITFGTDNIDINRKDLAAVYLMSIYAFNSTLKNRSNNGQQLKCKTSRLSPREIECILWVSRGKTSWEIGEILNIAKSTVDEYIVSVCRKTDSVTRAQAVAECIRQNEIAI